MPLDKRDFRETRNCIALMGLLLGMSLHPVLLLAQEDLMPPSENTGVADDNAEKDSALSFLPPLFTEETDMPAMEETLMFDPQKVQDLMAVYRAYQKNRMNQQGETAGQASGEENDRVAEIISKLEGAFEKEKEIPEEVLTLSLNSIVYYSPNDWSLWLNGTRHARKDALEGFSVGNSKLKVLSASKQEAHLVWLPMQTTLPKIRERMDKKDDAALEPVSHLAAAEKLVKLDEKGSDVHIVLHPNQTFFSDTMSVREGKGVAVPKAESNASPGNLPASGAMPGNIPPSPGNHAAGKLPATDNVDGAKPASASESPETSPHSSTMNQQMKEKREKEFLKQKPSKMAKDMFEQFTKTDNKTSDTEETPPAGQ